jgi:hypothetical protein
MKRRPKKKVSRPRVLWQLNPTTRVVESARKYSRRGAKAEARKSVEE